MKEEVCAIERRAALKQAKALAVTIQRAATTAEMENREIDPEALHRLMGKLLENLEKLPK